MTPILYSFENNDALSKALDHFTSRISAESIAKNGRFTIALSGGSLPKLFSAVLRHNKTIDFSKWHVFFSDERCVPLDHTDSNYLLCKQELFDHVGIPSSQIYPIDPTLTQDPAAAAKKYTESMKKVFTSEWPLFDLIMLGMGPDGHTCSLFPNHPLLKENSSWITSLKDSPKPPPRRITFTYPALNKAQVVAFVSTGAGKQDVLSYSLDQSDKKYPVQSVEPATGKLYWFVDNAASEKVTKVKKTQYQY